jgi:glutamate/tyrosine decarboxylase-like PLP-dependent enzyme
MKPDQLQDAIARDRNAGLLPVAVVASAGTTNTGAVDPLVAIADLCEREGLWLHVDAAYGGFTVLTDRGRSLLEGIGRADSITLDPHKWLFVPFECGCLMVKDPARLRDAFRILPEYLEALDTAAEEVNFADLGEQLSRYSRAFKVWLCVQYYGTDALGSAIAQGIRNAEIAEELIRQAPELEVLSPARLGILCFRARGNGDAATVDALNQRILQRVNDNARYFISTTRLNGALALRICTPGFRTRPKDIEGLIGEVREAAASV